VNALALPTRRDEDWRYADAEALAGLTPADLDVWHEAELAHQLESEGYEAVAA
jgi:Fe-S cluster assembly protein SufD